MNRFVYWRARTLLGPRWRWHLKARNGEILCHGESYRNRADCLRNIDLVKGSGGAIVEERK